MSLPVVVKSVGVNLALRQAESVYMYHVSRQSASSSDANKVKLAFSNSPTWEKTFNARIVVVALPSLPRASFSDAPGEFLNTKVRKEREAEREKEKGRTTTLIAPRGNFQGCFSESLGWAGSRVCS